MKKKWYFAVVHVLLLFSLVLTACGGGTKRKSDAPGHASAQGAGDSAAQGGSQSEMSVGTYAFNSEPVLNWDPAVEFSNGIVVMNNIYETLLRYNPDTKKPEKLLAEDYSHSDDAKTWTFTLRKGVKFHDGTEMNAEAVKFSIDRVITMNQGAAYIWDSVKDIEVKDDYTITFNLKYSAPLDLICSSAYAAFIVSPTAVKEHGDDWFAAGNEAGTGPYKLESSKMGEEVILGKFADYWQGWDGKHFDKVYFKKVPETASRRQLIETGEADITLELPYEDVNALKSNSNVNIQEESSLQNLMIFLNTAKEPLKNVLVRQAMSYAFPYNDVIKYAMGDYAVQSHGAIPEGLWGHGKDLPQYSFDLEKAKALLKEAGYEGGFNLLMTYMTGDESEKKTAELYQAELKKIGINMELRAMPWESQWELSKSTDPNQRQDVMAMYWWPDYSTPYSWLFNLFHSEDQILYNISYYKNSDYDKKVDSANEMAGTDRAASEKAFIDAQKILIDEAPAIFAYDKKTPYVLSKSFKGFKSNSSYPNVVFFYDCYREK